MRIRRALRAAADLRNLTNHIAAENPTAAIDVRDTIEAAINGLKTFSKKGRRGRVAGTYELVVVGTSYIVVYKIDGQIIFIVRVLHGAQQWPPVSATRSKARGK